MALATKKSIATLLYVKHIQLENILKLSEKYEFMSCLFLGLVTLWDFLTNSRHVHQTWQISWVEVVLLGVFFQEFSGIKLSVPTEILHLVWREANQMTNWGESQDAFFQDTVRQYLKKGI